VLTYSYIVRVSTTSDPYDPVNSFGVDLDESNQFVSFSKVFTGGTVRGVTRLLSPFFSQSYNY
jgi:hypothetical protein